MMNNLFIELAVWLVVTKTIGAFFATIGVATIILLAIFDPINKDMGLMIEPTYGKHKQNKKGKK